jgi:hypothetical protein
MHASETMNISRTNTNFHKRKTIQIKFQSSSAENSNVKRIQVVFNRSTTTNTQKLKRPNA